MMENNTCGTLLVCCECVCACVCMQEIVQLLEMAGFSRITVEKRKDEPGTGRHVAEWRQNSFFFQPLYRHAASFIAESGAEKE